VTATLQILCNARGPKMSSPKRIPPSTPLHQPSMSKRQRLTLTRRGLTRGVCWGCSVGEASCPADTQEATSGRQLRSLRFTPQDVNELPSALRHSCQVPKGPLLQAAFRPFHPTHLPSLPWHWRGWEPAGRHRGRVTSGTLRSTLYPKCPCALRTVPWQS